MANVLIVGCGNIGSRLYEEYTKVKPDRYDPQKGLLEKRSIKYDIAFIAVDTPMGENGECDLTQVTEAINQTDAEVIVLRSTVPPKTTEALKRKTGESSSFFFGNFPPPWEILFFG